MRKSYCLDILLNKELKFYKIFIKNFGETKLFKKLQKLIFCLKILNKLINFLFSLNVGEFKQKL